MANIIILIVFGGLVFLSTSVALGIIIAGNKGQNVWWSAALCLFLPIFGQIIIALKPMSDKNLVESMYERKLINKQEFTQTIDDLDNK